MKATWPAIISSDQFNAAQELLSEAKKLERVRLEGAEDRFYILTGILRCGECGSPLVGKSAHGRTHVHRYYGHTQVRAECLLHRVVASEVEKAVLDYVWSSIQDAGYLAKIEKNVREMRNVKSLDSAPEKRSIKEQLGNIQARIDSLLLMQGQTTSASALKLAMQAFEKLSNEKVALEVRLERMNKGSDRDEMVTESMNMIQDNLRDFKRGFTKANGSMKKRFIRKLLKQVIVTPDGIHIFMQLADGIEIPNHQTKLVQFGGPKATSESRFAITKKASGDDSNLEVLGSPIN